MFQYVVLGVRELTHIFKYLNFCYEKTTEMIHVLNVLQSLRFLKLRLNIKSTYIWALK